MKIKMTSAKANKMLRQLKTERNALMVKEDKSNTFLAVMGEDPETVRPAYDFEATQAALADYDAKIRALKHAIFAYNLNTVVEGFDMTIDEMLMYLPQLSTRKVKLEQMAARLPKEREPQPYGKTSNLVDYRYANYDIAKAEASLIEVSDLLARAQLALDKLNTTVEFEVEL